MADVAREAGVSLKTVSRVVNREPHTRPEVVERVTRAIAELGWVAHGGARAMRTGRTGRIAIAVSSLANPTTTMLVEALVAEAGRRGLTVGLEPTHDDPQRAERVLAACGRLYDGALILGGAAAGVSLADVSGTVVTVQGAQRGPDHLGSDLDAVTQRLTPGAPLIQFSYGTRAPVVPPPGHSVIRAALIWANIPPARVWVYRKI